MRVNDLFKVVHSTAQQLGLNQRYPIASSVCEVSSSQESDKNVKLKILRFKNHQYRKEYA